jgi:hypothetical protein
VASIPTPTLHEDGTVEPAPPEGAPPEPIRKVRLEPGDVRRLLSGAFSGMGIEDLDAEELRMVARVREALAAAEG